MSTSSANFARSLAIRVVKMLPSGLFSISLTHNFEMAMSLAAPGRTSVRNKAPSTGKLECLVAALSSEPGSAKSAALECPAALSSEHSSAKGSVESDEFGWTVTDGSVNLIYVDGQWLSVNPVDDPDPCPVNAVNEDDQWHDVVVEKMYVNNKQPLQAGRTATQKPREPKRDRQNYTQEGFLKIQSLSDKSKGPAVRKTDPDLTRK